MSFDSTGWNQETKQTDHTALMSYVVGLDIDALHYVRKDSLAAANALPDGDKASYYIDTAHYCGMELVKRQAKK